MCRTVLILLAGCLVLAGVSRAQMSYAPPVATFNGQDEQSTGFFDVQDHWSLRWRAHGLTTISVCTQDGAEVAACSGFMSGTLKLAKGGHYYLHVVSTAPNYARPPMAYTPPQNSSSSDENTFPPTENSSPSTQQNNAPQNNYAPPQPIPATWQISIEQADGSAVSTAPPSTAAATPSPVAPPTPVAPTPATNAAPAAPTAVSPAVANAIVVVRGDQGVGTGFLVQTPDGPAVVTNQHVLAANPNIQITTTSGAQIKIIGYKGASDRDLALVLIQDDHYSYLDSNINVASTAQPGDEVITPGNSEGGGVVLNTRGSVLGIGPDRVEISNPIFHGNSGGPLIHTKSGKVIGVVEGATRVAPSDDLDRASLSSSNSAINGTMRYFGLRLDNVPKWETLDWKQYLGETKYLDEFHEATRCLDSFLNGAHYEREHTASNEEDGDPPANYYKNSDKLVALEDNYHRLSADAGDAQRLDAVRELVLDLQGFGTTGLADVKNSSNFYGYDAKRAAEEAQYRQSLLDELDHLGDKVSDLGH
jgi:S1-C subfamily serine protease